MRKSPRMPHGIKIHFMLWLYLFTADYADYADEFSSLPPFFYLLLLAFAHQGDHDSLNLQFLLRDKLRVPRVFRAQVRFALLQDESLKGDLSIDQGGHDVAGTRLHAMFDNHDVAFDNVFAEHRVAMDLQAKSPGGWFNTEAIHVNEDAALLVLRGIDRPAGGNGSVDRHRNYFRMR